jgi:hypothetical protein
MRPATDERRWLAGLTLLTVCSWGRWLATGSPKVDENYPSELAGTVLFIALLLGWGLLVLGWRGMLLRPPASPRRLAFTGLLVASAMLPMLSNDVFSVLAYGSVAARGHDVYTTTAWLAQSPWQSWIGERWGDKVCVYGPPTLLATMPAAMVGPNPWLALLLLRLVWIPPVALVMQLSFRWLPDRPKFHAMVWLNPLFVLEGPGQLHADLLGLTALVAALVLQLRGRVGAAWGSYGLAAVSKYSFLPAGLWGWLAGSGSTAQRLLRLPALAGIVALTGAVLYAPFWHGFATLTEPLRTLATMNPGGSIVEVAGHLVRIVRGGGVPPADLPVTQVLALDRAQNGATWAAVSLLLRLVTLAIAARVLWALLRKPRDPEAIALGTGVLLVAMVTLASHRFECWYLMVALPFFGLGTTPAWQRWWLAAVALSVAPTFIHVLPRSAALLAPWGALSTGAMVIMFLWSFRARYFAFDAPPAATAPAAPSPPPAGS